MSLHRCSLFVFLAWRWPLVACSSLEDTQVALDTFFKDAALPLGVETALRQFAAASGARYDPLASCPLNVTTDPSLSGDRLLGYWDVLGVAHPAMEELFDCPMMNITKGGMVDKPGHNTENYKAYLAGHLIQFKGDEYAIDPKNPGTKLFSVLCLFGHCGFYIPYYWLETDAQYKYASVFYCWPVLPWLVRGYLVTSRVAEVPAASLTTQFIANASAQGLIPASTELRWSEKKPCWDNAADVAAIAV